MANSPLSSAELFDPQKHDPGNLGRRGESEEAFMKYNSIAGINPFSATPNFRETLENREHVRTSPSDTRQLNSEGELTHKHVYIFDHPALRDQYAREAMNDIARRDETLLVSVKIPADSTSIHKRLHSDHLPRFNSAKSFGDLKYAKHGISKSASDTNVLRQKNTFVTPEGSPQRRRKVSPSPVNTSQRLPTRQDLDTIQEQEAFAKNYKVEVRDAPDSEQKLVRSPLKKLFGDGGILGRSTSAKDLPDARFQRTGIKHWGEKMKARVEGMTHNIHLPTPQTKRNLMPGPSKFPVSLSPYFQGDFYMQMELLLSIETNNFLMHEFKLERLSIPSVRTIVQGWRNKGRPQVLGFRYDLCTQRELVGMDAESLHFSGINAFNRMRMLSVLAVWKVLAKEISIRTFCQPDSAVKKHLRDAEMVLEMIGASADGMLAFREMRTRVVAEMFREERKEKERREWDGSERLWSPSMLV